MFNTRSHPLLVQLDSADPTEVVAKSLQVCPPAAVSWSERYAGGKESWTKWIPFSGKKKKAA